jgi:hypothetical protein
MGGRTQHLGRAAWLIAIALTLLSMPGEAAADATAGRAAFERGDYQAAEAAWRPFAERGNAQAEFGLGEVEERGEGDYRRAEFWYEKAAADGSTEARYRLALIELAGSRDTPPDLVTAYKWALLAADAQDEWGRLAGDLVNLLAQHLSIDDKAAGQRQADAWRREHGGSLADPVAELRDAIRRIDCASLRVARVAAAAPVAPSSPFIRSSGQAVAAVSSPSPGLTTTAPTDGTVMIFGTVPDAAARAKLLELAGVLMPRMRPELRVDVLPPPLCRSLAALNAMRDAGLVSSDLYAQVNGGASVLSQGDPIAVEVKAGDYPVRLRIDYFSLDRGKVVHLLPDHYGRAVRLAAGADEVFQSSPSGSWEVGAAPFGTEFIAVLATPQPLDISSRPEIEPASKYLSALEAALRRGGSNSREPNLLATLLVHTEPRQ